MTELPQDLLEGLQRAPYPIYATDENYHLTAWNRAAEQLTGYPGEEVLGRECYSVISGKDVYGNDYCTRECNVVKMVRRNAAVKRFDLDLRCASSERIRAHCAILVVPGLLLRASP